jgi:predicted transposase/invertase (TIGR01784 family)
MFAEKPELIDYDVNLVKYDHIIFGFPVWASNFAPPLRTFISEHKAILRRNEISAFACQKASGAEKAMARLRKFIRVNEFNSLAKTPLEEWIDYLKSGRIKEDTKTPGLQEAREKLQYLTMSREDRLAYDRYIDAIMVQNDVLDTAKLEGRAEGLAEVRAKVRAEEKLEIARNMKHAGLDMEQISLFTGLSVEKIKEL